MRLNFSNAASTAKKLSILTVLPFIAAGCNFLSSLGLGSSSTLGVAKTVDGGSTWQAANKVSATASIGSLAFSAMAIAPSDHQTIYAGGTSGLWVSHDSAGTWKQVLSRVAVNDVYLDSSNPATIVVAGTYGSQGKIVESVDSGASWTETYNDSSTGTQVTGITANPSNTQQMFATLGSGTVIASADGGNTWAVATQFSGDVALGIRASNLNGELYLLLQHKGLQGSQDGGKTWSSLVGQLTASSFDFTSTNFSAQSVGTFYSFSLDAAAAGAVYVATASGLYRTADNGSQWMYVSIPTSTANVWPRLVASTDGGMVAYTSIGGTMYKTLDGGQSWRTDELPAGVTHVGAIAVDPKLPQITYVGLSSVASSY